MNIRDRIGFAIRKAMDGGAPEPDYYDSREIDRLADAVIDEFTYEIAELKGLRTLRKTAKTMDAAINAALGKIGRVHQLDRKKSMIETPCPQCQGTGDSIDHSRFCRRCRGTGTVPEHLADPPLAAPVSGDAELPCTCPDADSRSFHSPCPRHDGPSPIRRAR